MRLSESGKIAAERARKLQGLTHDQLAEKVDTTRQPVGRFFQGKSIADDNFVQLCEILGLQVQDVAFLALSTTPASPRLSANPNPFGDRGKITDPSRFFDRKPLFRNLFEELSRGGSLSLVGETQVGKSSVLQMIRQQGSQSLPLPPEAFLYLDMQCIRDETDFFDELCWQLGIQPSCRGATLRRKLRGKRYILCLDEIEKMKRTAHFTGDERTELRGLADGADAPLTLAIASRSPLSDLFPDSPELASPLAGICRQFDVLPFPPEIARDFLVHRLQGTEICFSDSEIEALLERSQGHPARLQEVAYNLYQSLTSVV